MIYFNCLLLLLAVERVVSVPSLVKLPGLGLIVGTRTESAWTQRPIYQFLGINYAQSPRGIKRFQAPFEVEPWLHVYDASKPGQPCPSIKNLAEVRAQENTKDVEDCLSLSVHTPRLDGHYPVIFYVHGEFFFDGSAEEAQPQYLLEKDVVLVSVQYRLAPFGFLSTLTEAIPGNIAALDVMAALAWVHKYIQFFGGDDREITIVGQGSGAGLVHLLTLTPLVERPLFKRVILQSGSLLSPYFVTDKSKDHAMDIAHKAKCPGLTTIEGVNQCFLLLSPGDLIQAFANHARPKEGDGVGHYGGFQWTVGDPFGILPVHPSRLVRDSSHFYYPMIGGVTKNVGSFYFARQILKRLRLPDNARVDIEEMVETVLKHSLGDDEFGIWKTLSIENLFESEQIEESTLAAVEPGLIDLLSNILYKGPVLQAVQMNSKFLPNDTYLYTFDYKGQFSRYPNHGTKNFGVSLSDDNLYLFPYPAEYSKLNLEDTKIARLMVDLWTSFAITGEPESEDTEEWLPVTMVTGPYLSIDTEETVRYDFIEEMTRTNNDLQSYK